MLKFNPNDPFPLLPLNDKSVTSAQARNHSAQVDSYLGLEIEKVEKELITRGYSQKNLGVHKEPQELWIGLDAERFLTPYTEIRIILSLLEPRQESVVVDLGAAYGRMGFVIGRHYPKVKFIGYEYVGERVAETRKCLAKFRYPLVTTEQVDLSSMEFHPATADFYFIYDYGTPEAIKKTLHDLRRVAMENSITVVGRGRSSRDEIEQNHPWLLKIDIPKCHVHFSIYRST